MMPIQHSMTPKISRRAGEAISSEGWREATAINFHTRRTTGGGWKGLRRLPVLWLSVFKGYTRSQTISCFGGVFSLLIRL